MKPTRITMHIVIANMLAYTPVEELKVTIHTLAMKASICLD